jgi:hypothetical protein
VSDQERQPSEPLREFTMAERVAVIDLVVASLERRADRARRLRLLIAVNAAWLAPPLFLLAFYTFPIVQVCVGFCVYAGAVMWLICGDTSPLRSHRHG